MQASGIEGITMEVKLEYLAAGGNRHPSAADWDTITGVLAFGSGRNLAVWKPLDSQSPGITALYTGHSDSINAVKFLRRPANEGSVVITGAADKTLRVWQSPSSNASELGHVATLEGHTGSINCIATSSRGDIIVSGAADGTLKIWKVSILHDRARGLLLQSIKLTPKFFPLAITLCEIDSPEAIVLAVGGTKSFIQIYAGIRDAAGLQISYKSTLTGHEGWIRSLDFVQEIESYQSDILLASASQDKYMRLWRLHRGHIVSSSTDVLQHTPIAAAETTLSNKAHVFEIAEIKYSLTFEALLFGHEDWIYTARWSRTRNGLRLLSASADNSLAIWEADPVSGIWFCISRLGEISAQKGSTTATGSSGGFWVGLWSSDGQSVVSLGRTGSWRQWYWHQKDNRWDQVLGISGHIGEVRGLSWSRAGTYLLSASADQTTRLHALWIRSSLKSWHEIARPQIHGYDLNCVDSLGESQFISGADEKLLRVFDEPRNVAEVLANISGILKDSSVTLPEAADMPVLGLSNKAMDVAEDSDTKVVSHAKEIGPVDTVPSLDKPASHPDQPPFEDVLARYTLWPEHEKLYGHGYETSAIASSHDGSLIATACKASSSDHAVIRLYETKNWREIKPPLKAHALTVTCLRFSDDDQLLLSVGRDRQWTTFIRGQTDPPTYSLSTSNPKAHSRMILGAAWAPSRFRKLFSTAGRDKSIKLWSEQETTFSCQASIQAPAAVTTVAFHQDRKLGGLLLAAGLETGDVFIHIVDHTKLEVTMTLKLDIGFFPSLSVTQLVWQPNNYGGAGGGPMQNALIEPALLAISSEDCSVRILSIRI